MANETRKRANAVSGVVDNNPLAAGGTSLASTELSALPAVDATEHMALTLDQIGTGNGPEIVYVTAHTAGSTGATIVRGREGTTGVSPTSTMTWVHGPTAADFVPFHCTSTTRPSGTGLPYEGMTIYETDTNLSLIYNGTNWVQLDSEGATVTTSESTAATSYTDLATSGPAVTLVTGTKVLITITSEYTNSGINITAMSIAVSGATTLAAGTYELKSMPVVAGQYSSGSASFYVSGLTAGSNTFTAKYAVVGGIGYWLKRHILVQAIP